MKVEPAAGIDVAQRHGIGVAVVAGHRQHAGAAAGQHRLALGGGESLFVSAHGSEHGDRLPSKSGLAGGPANQIVQGTGQMSPKNYTVRPRLSRLRRFCPCRPGVL